MISINNYVSPAKDIAFREIDEEIIILTLEDTTLYRMNKVGEEIWRLASSGNNYVDQIVKAVSQRYGIPYKEAKKDVIEFLAELQDKGIIVINKK